MNDDVKVSISLPLGDFNRLPTACPKCGSAAYEMKVHLELPGKKVAMLSADYGCWRHEFVMLQEHTGKRGSNGVCRFKGNDPEWTPGITTIWYPNEPRE